MNKFLLLLIGISLLILAIPRTTERRIRPGDWICWASPSEEALRYCQPRCSGVGTYAYSRNKDIATSMALSLCGEEYGGTQNCKLDYCEQVKGDRAR
jgi:hypothetical protein